MNDTLAIDVAGMTKRFGKRVAVDHIDLQVRTGEICGFLGPNGSGKTTFLRMLCGLLRPDDGHGTCLGFDVIRQSAEIKRQVGYMTQKFTFWEDSWPPFVRKADDYDPRGVSPWSLIFRKRHVCPLHFPFFRNSVSNL